MFLFILIDTIMERLYMRHFNKEFNKASHASWFIANEVIEYQKDDNFTSKLEACVEEFGFNNTGDYELSGQSIDLQAMNTTLAKLSKLVSDRVGMNLFFVYDPKTYGLSTYPITLNVNSIFLEAREGLKEVIANVKDDINEYGVSKADAGFIIFLQNIKRALTDKRLRDLYVNGKEAKVYNLPKDYTGYIYLNIPMLKSFKFTTKMVTAGILHEVGHSFSSIENAYKSVNSSLVLLESIAEGFKKGKSIQTSIIRGYEAITNEKINPNTPIDKVLAALAEIEARRTILGNERDYSYYTDFERAADLFASRFGYAAEVVQSLKLVGPGIERSEGGFIHTILGTAGFITCTWIVIHTAAYIISSFFLTTILVALILSKAIYALFVPTEYDDNVKKTYDALYVRMEKMKLDLIRVIRTTPDLDNLYKKRMIEQFESIEKILSTTNKPSMSFILKLHTMMSSSRKRLFDMKQSDHMIERLIENELHMASTKINQYA